MAEIKSGVLLKLKDEFSKGMGKAAGTSGDFAGKTLGALDKVNSALSGTAARIGAFGVTLSLGAAAKEMIGIDHRMTRLGLTAGASAEQVAKLKQRIFETAQSPDIKIDPKEILSGLEVVMEKVGDMRFVEDNIRNIGLAIQATGESGGAMGDVFSEFAKFGYTAEQVNRLLDDMAAQGDLGQLNFAEFAKNAPAVFSAYSVIGTSPEDMKNAYAAMQIIAAGTKSPEIAVTALNSTVNELADPDKQKKLGRLIGEKIGAAAGKEAENKVPEMPPVSGAASTAMAYGIPYSQLPPEITGYNPYAPGQQTMRFDGSVGLQTDLYIHQDGSFTATQKTRNHTEFPFEIGNARTARGYN